jgi:formamidopyrimidine-DNA glycosylase
MPELPDVEIARRDLERWAVGATIVAAQCGDRYLLRPGSPRAFTRALVGKKVDAIERKGKWLRLALNDGGRLFSHLGMTGDWVSRPIGAPPQRSERARLDVARGRRLSSVRYLDPRRFGRLIAARRDIPEWTALGPDPLSDGIDLTALSPALAVRRRAVKELLMDQAILAGVGNILATEALWMARVDPRVPGSALRPSDVRAIVRGLRRAIARELADRGPRGGGGEGESAFFVYGRRGQPCPRCGTALSSVTLGGRTSVFCPHCQARRR